MTDGIRGYFTEVQMMYKYAYGIRSPSQAVVMILW